MLAEEEAYGLLRVETYAAFSEQAQKTKHALMDMLLRIKAEGKTVAAYGAAAKGNTLFNYCGIGTDLVHFVVDKSPHKQNRYLPGSHLPIHAPEEIDAAKPDFVLILPWNLQDEIIAQLQQIKTWGGQFIIPIPSPRILAP